MVVWIMFADEGINRYSSFFEIANNYVTARLGLRPVE